MATQTPTACAWCEAPLEAGAAAPRGRLACARCGAETTSPWPTDAELEAAYGGWYRPPSGRFGAVGDALLRRTRGSLARRIDRTAPPGRVLDVGCGDGALLDALAARGRAAVGLERRSARADVREADVTEVGDEFAAVVFWHSLEHLRTPGRALRHAASLLSPGGLLVVAVPNRASLQAEAFGEHWLALDLPRHLVHLPAATLLAEIERCGLRVRRVSHLRGGQVVFGWLHGLVGRLPGRPDLYDAVRSPAARSNPVAPLRRLAALSAAAALLPVALAAAAAEAALRRGGSVYVEAQR